MMYSEFLTLLYSIIRSENKRSVMKRKLLTLLSIAVLTASTGMSYAKTTNNSELVTAIKLYKAQDYTSSYSKLQTSIKKDPSNPLAYYYLAMVYSQLGNAEEAKKNYEKTVTLTNENSKLHDYALKGRICLESEEACKEFKDKQASSLENLTKGFSKKVHGEYEKLKIENLMREMNRSDDIPASDFREYRDFSSMNNQAAPSNDEIVAAIRTLQNAGLMNSVTNGYSDLSLLTGLESQQNNWYGAYNNGQLSPQVIQAMLSNNMSFGF